MPSDEVLEGSVFPPLDTNAHLCIHNIVFKWMQSGQLSEHHTQHGEEYYTKEEISNKQYRQTLARQMWCLPKKGNVYRQGSWKSSNTSAQGICLPSGDVSCSLKVCLDSLLLQENIVPFQQYMSRLNLFHTEKKRSLLCISLPTQDCSVTTFPLRGRC